ncbi:hypothetical protein ACHAW5_004240, partial [Stephanodiscus triporus]
MTRDNLALVFGGESTSTRAAAPSPSPMVVVEAPIGSAVVPPSDDDGGTTVVRDDRAATGTCSTREHASSSSSSSSSSDAATRRRPPEDRSTNTPRGRNPSSTSVDTSASAYHPTSDPPQFGLAVGSMVPRRPPSRGSRPGDERSRGGAGVPTEAGSWQGEVEDEGGDVDGDEIANRSEEGEDEEGPSTAADARREEEEDQDQEECRQLKSEADAACRRVGRRYDALVKFASGHPRGEYGEFVEFLLMGGGMSEGAGESGDEYLADMMNEDFYDENSACRKLWNDNLNL